MRDYSDVEVTEIGFGMHGLVVSWSSPTIGVGTTTIYKNGMGIKLDDEAMGPEFCKHVFGLVIDHAFAAK